VVSNCANPACATPLRYLRDGRLYQFEVKSLDNPGANPLDSENGNKKRSSRQVWHFWLCGQCSSNLTLKFDQRGGLKLIPLYAAYTH
jgi:hypothetical protein